MSADRKRVAARAVLAVVLMLACLGGLAAGPAWAISSPDEMLPNRAQELRAEALGGQLRCLVCQNESIEESDADLARDLRRDIRRMIVEGKTDPQIIAWMTARYGDFVRLRPPWKASTILLWGSPLIALGVGAVAIVLARRQRRAAAPPLSRDEERRLAELLRRS